MNTRTAPSPLACTAIAAVLAAVSTPAFAQETAPADPAPVAAAPAPAAPVEAPAPEAAAPAAAAAPAPEMRASPMVQPVPETPAAPVEEVAAAPAAPVKAAPRASASRPVSAAPAAVAQSTSITPVAAPSADAQKPTDALAATGAAIGSAAVANQTPPAVAAVPSGSDNTAEIGLGVLGLLALGGAGAYAVSRRRRRMTAEEPVYSEAPLRAEPPLPEHAVPVQAIEVATEPAPVAWNPAATGVTAAPVMAFASAPVAHTPARDIETRREPAPAAGRSAAMIPAGPLPNGTALTDLFNRMAQAAPDEDNPYTSPKRRRQRVRWLMKQHEYRLRDKSTEKFDFRTYTPSSKLAHDEGIGEEVVPA